MRNRADGLGSERDDLGNPRCTGALANCRSASVRRTTRTCCTPPLSSLASSFWSFGVTSILRGGRPIH
jgi:hypothetical protein